MELQRQSNAQVITPDLTIPLGHGGEAFIYAVRQDESLAAKVYHQSANTHHAHKLIAMLANPPDNPMAEQGHISISWPVDLLLAPEMRRTGREEKQKQGKIVPKDSTAANPTLTSPIPDSLAGVVGFLMPRVKGMRPILDLYNPKTRRQHCPLFNYLYLHRTARNLAAAIGALHARGYCIGDVNESNILASDTALVTLVDTDSFQVPDPQNGTIYRCPVGRPEFTPPELQGKSFAQLDRNPEHDLFGLAVLIFQLLMEGMHPFSGVFQGMGDPPPYEVRIAVGHFPYSQWQSVPYVPTPMAPPWEILHPTLRELFARCFESGHYNPRLRPTAQNWQDAIAVAENSLVTCATNDQHRYGDHLNSCPWCDRTLALGGRDPFPSWQVVQLKQHLPPKPRKRVSQQIRSQALFPHFATPILPMQKSLLGKILENKRLCTIVFSLVAVSVYGYLKLLGSMKSLSFASQTSPRHASATTHSDTQHSSGDSESTMDAIEKSSQVLRLNPNDSKAYFNRGNARYNLADYQGAMDDFSQALHLNPKDAKAYFNRGVVRYEVGQYSSDPSSEINLAIEDFNQAVRLNPKDADAYFKRGVARYESGQYSSNPVREFKLAIEDFNQAVRLNPNNNETYVKRGIAHYKIAQYDGDSTQGYTGAIEDFNQALRLNPNNAEAYGKRGTVRYEMAQHSGKYHVKSKEAVEDLQKAAHLFLEQGDMENYQQALGNTCMALEKKCDSTLHNLN